MPEGKGRGPTVVGEEAAEAAVVTPLGSKDTTRSSHYAHETLPKWLA